MLEKTFKEVVQDDERKARKCKRLRKKKQKADLEIALCDLHVYIGSCPWEVNQAFLLVRKWARKGLRSS